jgi:sec-independent protein translocase protein TatA
LIFCGRNAILPVYSLAEVNMFGIGMPELIVILVIVLVVFGAGRLPEIGSALGKSIRNFKKASDGKDEIDIKPKKDNDTKEG